MSTFVTGNFNSEKAFIQNELTPAELWGQLAEEAAELAQAALKMQRHAMGVNLPRLSEEECRRAVVEEHADLALCFEMLGWEDSAECRQLKAYKLKRWAIHLHRIVG